MIPGGSLEFSSISPQSHSKEHQNDMDYLYFRNHCVILCLNVGQESNQEILLEDLGVFPLSVKLQWNTFLRVPEIIGCKICHKVTIKKCVIITFENK